MDASRAESGVTTSARRAGSLYELETQLEILTRIGFSKSLDAERTLLAKIGCGLSRMIKTLN